MTRAQQRQAKQQARANARISRIQKRYGLISGGVTVPASSLPPPPLSSPITAVMDPAVPTTSTATIAPPTDPLAPPVLLTDPMNMAASSVNYRTPLPKITKQQLKWERRQLKALPKQLAKINRLNRLREMQEFTLTQQQEQAPDYSVIRGGPQTMYQRAGTEGGSAAYPAYDPMAAGVPPGPGAPYPGSFGPPQNFFSPPAQFQPSMGYPSGGFMMPPSQSGVPGGLIYADQPLASEFTPTYPEMDVNAEPIFEDEGGDQFFTYSMAFADMEPLDSYGAVTGEPSQVGFFDKLAGLVTTAGSKYTDIQTAKYAAKRPVPRPAPAPTPPMFNQQTIISMGLVVLGGLLLLKVAGGK